MASFKGTGTGPAPHAPKDSAPLFVQSSLAGFFIEKAQIQEGKGLPASDLWEKAAKWASDGGNISLAAECERKAEIAKLKEQMRPKED